MIEGIGSILHFKCIILIRSHFKLFLFQFVSDKEMYCKLYFSTIRSRAFLFFSVEQSWNNKKTFLKFDFFCYPAAPLQCTWSQKMHLEKKSSLVLRILAINAQLGSISSTCLRAAITIADPKVKKAA